MNVACDFTIYPICHPQEFCKIYEMIYREVSETKYLNLPSEFLRSQHSNPLSATITISLQNLKQEIQEVLQKQSSPQQKQPFIADWGLEFQDLPSININENDLFVSNYNNKNSQLVNLLKSAGMDILRFVSQLTDMYNDSEFTNKNKSLSSLLAQDRLQMQEADILTEMRHSLTHKQFPSVQFIVSAIDYLLMYLKDSFWNKLLEEFKQFDQTAKIYHTQIKKRIRKQIKSSTLSKQDFILFSRNYVKDQLTDLYKAPELIFEAKLNTYTKMVRQLSSTHFYAEYLLVYLFSKIIKQSGFMESENQQDYLQFLSKKLVRQRKLKITSKYIIELFQEQKKQNIFKTIIIQSSRRINMLISRMQNIGCVDEEVQRLLDNLKIIVQIKIENLALSNLNQIELEDVSVVIDKYLQDDVVKPNFMLFGSKLHAYLNMQ